MANWYVIFTKPREERKAKLNLERQGYQVYLPVVQTKLCGIRSTEKKELMFPQYIFVWLDEHQSNFYSIRYTRGVADFVRFGDLIPKVENEVVRSIQESELNWEALSTSLSEGDRVSLVKGALKGLEAIVLEQRGQKRVILLIELLKRSVCMETSSDSITKVVVKKRA